MAATLLQIQMDISDPIHKVRNLIAVAVSGQTVNQRVRQILVLIVLHPQHARARHLAAKSVAQPLSISQINRPKHKVGWCLVLHNRPQQTTVELRLADLGLGQGDWRSKQVRLIVPQL